jgi:hypothetical protein
MQSVELYYDNLPTRPRVDVLSEIVAASIQQVYVHPVTFVLQWAVSYDIGDSAMRIRDTFDKNTANDIIDMVKEEWNWDTVVLPDTTKLTIRATKGRTGNQDIRGGGCGNMFISSDEFVYRIESEDGITLRDLTEAVYRMKGSKYDWWYELYSSLRVTNEEEGHLQLEVEFDYGS